MDCTQIHMAAASNPAPSTASEFLVISRNRGINCLLTHAEALEFSIQSIEPPHQEDCHQADSRPTQPEKKPQRTDQEGYDRNDQFRHDPALPKGVFGNYSQRHQ